MDLPPFIAPRLKLQRARDHISELDRAITSFLARKPFSLVIEQKEEWHAWTARLRDNVPLEFSAIIGDAVHNLRTALDVLACDLVSINGQSTRSVYFPFAADPADLKHQIRKKNLHRAGPDIVDLVLSLRPYRGGNLALRAIHDLDIRDKHQALIPVANVVDAPGGTLMLGGHPNKIPNWQSRVTYDGQIIVMMPAVANLSEPIQEVVESEESVVIPSLAPQGMEGAGCGKLSIGVPPIDTVYVIQAI